MYDLGQYVTFTYRNQTRVGCVLGRSRQKDFPWRVAVMPLEPGDENMTHIVNISTAALKSYAPPRAERSA